MRIEPSGIDIPDGAHPVFYVWGEMVPGIGMAASTFAQSVYEHTTLGLREFEAAPPADRPDQRVPVLPDWRTDRDGETVEEGFDDAVEHWRTTDTFDERDRLAAEWAERFALDHHGIDADLWPRMHAAFTQVEIVELSMCLGSWIAFGRLNHVLGLDAACTLPGPPAGLNSARRAAGFQALWRSCSSSMARRRMRARASPRHARHERNPGLGVPQHVRRRR